MPTDFSRSLSLLRKEKGVSQRIAAGALGVSQALLSHYETGAREPGLPFIRTACDYYEVSSDFLLGRTLMRDGTEITLDRLADASGDKGNRLSGQTASALMGKKLVINAVSALFDLAGRSGSPGLASELTRFFGGAVYKIFRDFYAVAGQNPESFFSVPACAYDAASSADMALAEARIMALLNIKNGHPVLPDISNDTLAREYPMLMQSLLKLVHESGERCAAMLTSN